MPLEIIALRGFMAAVVAYLCLLGPGQAWRRGRNTAAPSLFSKVTLSILWTSVLALVLTAFDHFSVATIVMVNGFATLFGFLFFGRAAELGASAARPDKMGLVAGLLALAIYWPAFETELGALDATTYTAAGVHLGETGHLWKTDEASELLSPYARRQLFRSLRTRQSFPPFERMAGGMVVHDLSGGSAWPNFFPLPMIWSAIFSQTLGPRFAGGFAPLFGAMAVWATWLFTRRRLDPLAAAVTTGLVATNAASLWFARMPLADPLAWFFVWSGLVSLDVWEDDGFTNDARLAGATLGAAVLTRAELAVFLLPAFACRRFFRVNTAIRPLPVGFYIGAAVFVLAALLQFTVLHGTYLEPLRHVVRGAIFKIVFTARVSPWAFWPTVVVGTAALAWAIKRFGFARTVFVASILATAGVYFGPASENNIVRSLRWLAGYLGPATLVLGLVGLGSRWRNKTSDPADLVPLALIGIAAGLLVFDPHVTPVLPWAIRRMSSIVIPGLIVFGAIACTLVFARSYALGLLAWVVLLGSTGAKSIEVWDNRFHRGSYDEAVSLAEAVPKDGFLLIDQNLGGTIMGSSLWLRFGIPSLPVNIETPRGRHAVTATVWHLSAKGPAYLVRSIKHPEPKIPATGITPHGEHTIQLDLPATVRGSVPNATYLYTETLAISRLVPFVSKKSAE